MSKALAITKAQRRQIEAAADVLKPWGLTWSAEQGGKHLIMKVGGPKGGEWRLVIACPPRDPDNAIDHTRQKAKRLVHEINDRAGVYAIR